MFISNIAEIADASNEDLQNTEDACHESLNFFIERACDGDNVDIFRASKLKDRITIMQEAGRELAIREGA